MSIFQVYTEDTSQKSDAIVLRDEQKEAIEKAKAAFTRPFVKEKSYLKYLWNAKMRFGKTLCALHLAKDMEFRRTLIVTHRPVVNDNWKGEFKKVFADSLQYRYGTKFGNSDDEGNYDELEEFASAPGGHNHYVFFVSMQYLRLSSEVRQAGDHSQLKKKILENQWDFVVVDEAHEGTQTALGEGVIKKLSKPGTRVLHLSGTPFNLVEDFKDGEIYTWDYIMEQQAKKDWPEKHPGQPNPYQDLPAMKIFTYDLGKLMKGKDSIGQDDEFTFTEFFRTWTGNPRHDGRAMPPGALGHFVHETAVREFIDLLCKKDEDNNYPFSTEEYQKAFKHTLWVVPGIKAAAALERLLKGHRIFHLFEVVNVAGKSEDEETRENALDRVKNKIGADPEQTYTITLSCGRLTTGTTIKPWTAVFYLKGSEMTSAATYMQTIFRVQTPYHTIDGRMKAECYVFDFAPDRSLKMMAETARFSKTAQQRKRGARAAVDDDDLSKMKEFLSFCPVISLDGGQMVPFDEHKLFAQLQSVLIDRIARNGFDDNALYNVDALMGVDKDELNNLGDELAKTTNESKPPRAKDTFRMGQNGLTGKERKDAENARKKQNNGQPLTPEERAALEKERQAKAEEHKERENRIKILRGISLRIPLLIFGAELTDEDTGITIDNFTTLVDNDSWEEFMPRGVTKEQFNKFKTCYDAVKFAEAGKRYREWARLADSQTIDERIKTITTIHGYFRNPDKETVLTPWKVVNLHLSSTLGGYCFFNESFDGPNLTPDGEETTTPRWVDQADISDAIFKQVELASGKSPVRILEINSKTGLYPLYMAYSIFRSIRDAWKPVCDNPDNPNAGEEDVIWDTVLQENIFVICNTPMAARITERTLRGFRCVNGMHIMNIQLIKEATKDQNNLVDKLNSEQFWLISKENKKMKFAAIVGNPPYQEVTATKQSVTNGQARSKSIFQFFQLISEQVATNITSLIYPGRRWMHRSGKGMEQFGLQQINDTNLVSIDFWPNANEIFKDVDIADGITIVLKNIQKTSKGFTYTYHKDGFSKSVQLNPPGSKLIALNPVHDSIIAKVEKFVEKYKLGYINAKILPQKLFHLCG